MTAPPPALSPPAPPPRVSVLLPVRNGEPYFAAALDSMLAQTFADFELLVVDDGSSDGTPALLAACDDPRLRVIRLEGTGLVVALNTALAAARGDYVARMDADDIALPERLAVQVAVLDADPAVGLVHATARIIDGQGRYLRDFPAEALDPEQRVAVLLGDVPGKPIVHPTVMMRRQWLLDIGGYRHVPSSEDHELWLRVAETWRFHAIEAPLLLYRKHDKGISRERAAEQMLSNLLNCVCFLHRRRTGIDLLVDDPDAYRRLRERADAMGGGLIGKVVAARKVRAAVGARNWADVVPALVRLALVGGLPLLSDGAVHRRLRALRERLLATLP